MEKSFMQIAPWCFVLFFCTKYKRTHTHSHGRCEAWVRFETWLNLFFKRTNGKTWNFFPLWTNRNWTTDVKRSYTDVFFLSMKDRLTCMHFPQGYSEKGFLFKNDKHFRGEKDGKKGNSFSKSNKSRFIVLPFNFPSQN